MERLYKNPKSPENTPINAKKQFYWNQKNNK